jgi:hypothetical protein
VPDPRTPPVTEADLMPPLFRASDAASLAGQARALRLTRLQLVLLTVATLFATLPQTTRRHGRHRHPHRPPRPQPRRRRGCRHRLPDRLVTTAPIPPLATAYRITAKELKLVRAQLADCDPSAPDADAIWSRLARDAEDAISREHTTWQARRELSG